MKHFDMMLFKRIGFFAILAIFSSLSTTCNKDDCYLCTLRDPQSTSGNFLHKDWTCSQSEVDEYIRKGYRCTPE